jgi:uncharacterized protein (TIGR03067 family)
MQRLTVTIAFLAAWQATAATVPTEKLKAPGNDKDGYKKALERLQGRWWVCGIGVRGGRAPFGNFISEEFSEETYLVVTGDKFLLTSKGKMIAEGRLRLDHEKKALSIDLIPTKGPDKGKAILGIYVFKRARWKMCLSEAGRARPKSFEDDGLRMELERREEVVRIFSPDDNPRAKETREDLKKLQGNWKLVSCERNGRQDLMVMRAGLSIFIKGTAMTLRSPAVDRTKTTLFKIDATKKPKEIDMAWPDRLNKTLLGIYELEGDRSKICQASLGKNRPSKLTTKKNSDPTLMVFQRIKP